MRLDVEAEEKLNLEDKIRNDMKGLFTELYSKLDDL